MDMSRNEGGFQMKHEKHAQASDTIENFSEYSADLKRIFYERPSRIFAKEKKFAGDILFNLLECAALFNSTAKQKDDETEERKVRKLKHAHGNILIYLKCETRYPTYWQMAKFDDICCPFYCYSIVMESASLKILDSFNLRKFAMQFVNCITFLLQTPNRNFFIWFIDSLW